MYKRISQEELDAQLDKNAINIYCPLAKFRGRPFVREYHLDGSVYLIVITPMPASHDIISAPYQQWTDYGYGENPVDQEWLEARFKDKFPWMMLCNEYRRNLITCVINTQRKRLEIIQELQKRIARDPIPF
jgi:hypothetical protein